MEQLKRKVKGLRLKYRSQPQKDLLIALPNPCPDREYEVEITTTEFTCLCPLNPDQPDWATINIRYVPDKQIIELKSLKFYLTSYRMVEMFHEAATNRILDDLVSTIRPLKLEVTADWNIRGGIGTRIKVGYNRHQSQS